MVVRKSHVLFVLGQNASQYSDTAQSSGENGYQPNGHLCAARVAGSGMDGVISAGAKCEYSAKDGKFFLS